MQKILRGCLLLLLLVSAASGWSKTLAGQTVSGKVMLESGDVFALPWGSWEVLDKKFIGEAYGSGYDVLVLRNAQPQAAVPLLVIRQTAAPVRWTKTNCDYPSYGVLPAQRYGTKSSDTVSKCARIWRLASYAQWLQSNNAREESWWKDATEKFPDLGSVGKEPMLIAEFQITRADMRAIQFEAFARTAQLGITPNTISEEARRGLSNPIHQALGEWQASAILAAEAAVYSGRAQEYEALEAVYATHGLADVAEVVPAPDAYTDAAPVLANGSLEARSAFSGRWPNDPADAKFQAVLGWRYKIGEDLPKDPEHAYELFRRSAEQGNAEGIQGLAWMYLEGLEGLPQNETKGFALMRQAMDKGNPNGTAHLGHLYQEAMGVAKSDTQAIRYYRLAIERGAPWGAMYLARSYRDHRGVPKDDAEAAYWFGKAAGQGLAQARNELAGLPASSRSAALARMAQESGGSAPAAALAAEPVVPAVSAASTSPSPPAIPGTQSALALNANRKALVIGNDQYRSVTPLLNARADARAVSAELQHLGFKVTTLLDLNERDMKQAVREFKAGVEGGDEVLFYYAGHGVQLGNANYLLPVDIRGDNEEQVRDEAIQLQRVLDDMQERRAKFTLAVVDACRDNPFKSSGRNIGGRGLAPTTAATGQMIIFSAGSGQQALDKLGGNDRDPNSVFARTFIREMGKPGITVDRILRNVRHQVVEMARSVGHEQVPALYDQVVGDFYFRQ